MIEMEKQNNLRVRCAVIAAKQIYAAIIPIIIISARCTSNQRTNAQLRINLLRS